MNDELPVTELELSIRSQGVLEDLGVQSLAQLAALSQNDVAAHPRATSLVLRELSEVLAENGLGFRKG